MIIDMISIPASDASSLLIINTIFTLHALKSDNAYCNSCESLHNFKDRNVEMICIMYNDEEDDRTNDMI